MMPPLKLLRHVIDKMKNISDFLAIEANMGGKMVFKVETETVTIHTIYLNLEHPQIGMFFQFLISY